MILAFSLLYFQLFTTIFEIYFSFRIFQMAIGVIWHHSLPFLFFQTFPCCNPNPAYRMSIHIVGVRLRRHTLDSILISNTTIRVTQMFDITT